MKTKIILPLPLAICLFLGACDREETTGKATVANLPPDTVVAMVKITGEQFDDPEVPVVASTAANTKLVTELGKKLNQDPSGQRWLLAQIMVGHISLTPFAAEILKRDGVTDQDIEMLRSISDDTARQRADQRATSELLRKKLADLGVSIPRPQGWTVPYVVGVDRYDPFSRELNTPDGKKKPFCHLHWIHHKNTGGFIEVLVYEEGGFPLAAVVVQPQKWISDSSRIVSYKCEGQDVTASVIKYKNSSGAKIRESYTDHDKEILEDTVCFSSDKVFVIVSLKANRSRFDDLEKQAFIPFLDSIMVRKFGGN